MRKLSRMLLAVGAGVAVAAALAACGGSSSPSTAPATATSSQQRFVAALTQFSGCMRRHGIPVPDPNSQGVISGSQQLQQQYQDTPEGQAALRACRGYLQAAVPSAPQRKPRSIGTRSCCLPAACARTASSSQIPTR